MLLLGSQSKSRYLLLRTYNSEIKQIASNIEERYNDDLSIDENVMAIAKSKAMDIIEHNDIDFNEDILICADTMVMANNRVLGKPCNYDDAFAMIALILSNEVTIVTGVYLRIGSEVHQFSEQSTMRFVEPYFADIGLYLRDVPYYKECAGALAIEAIDNYFTYLYSGSYSNIIGLPMEKVSSLLFDSVAIERVSYATPVVDDINLYRSSVRTFIMKDDKVVLLKSLTLDLKELFYMSVGGGYHRNEDKEVIIVKEAQEEAGLIVGNLEYLTSSLEYSQNFRFYHYNKVTLHTYYISYYQDNTIANYVEYEKDVLKGIEYFSIDDAIKLLEQQLVKFEKLEYPVEAMTLSDLNALYILKERFDSNEI
jgi:septum formation protein